MSLRVLATLAITFLAIVYSFRDAFYGLIGYTFWSYTYPEKITWGLLPMQGLSYIMGLTVIWTTYMQKRKLWSGNRMNKAIIVFWLFTLIGAITEGLSDSCAWQFKFFSRVILITLVITVLVEDLKKFRYYLWAIAIFIGLIAARSGYIGTLRGDAGGVYGGYGGPIGDRNYQAVFLCIAIPIIYNMIYGERKMLGKLFLLIIFFGDICAVILTYSRAGFIGLIAAAIFIVMKSKRKIFILAAALMIFFIYNTYVVQEQYKARVSTITSYREAQPDADGSITGRLMAWRCALEMINRNPVMGVGFRNSEPSMQYYPDPKTGRVLPGKAIHNTLLMVGAELGIPALFLYVGIFFCAYRKLGAIKRKIAEGSPNYKAIWHYASMLQASFMGFFASSFFVNAAYVDISWHLVGLTIALEQIVNKETGINTDRTNER